MFKNRHVKKRLYIFIITATVISFLFYMLLTLLSKNISFFYTTTEVLKYINNQNLLHDEINAAKQVTPQPSKAVRVSGIVVKNSIEKTDGKITKFEISDGITSMIVNYTGILPPIFREGLQIIAKGHISIQDGKYMVEAQQILGKHDEKYIPKSKYQEHGDSHGI